MIEVTLHARPRSRDFLLEHVRAVGISLRREAMVLGVVLAVTTLIIAIDIARGNASSWFDSGEWAPIGFVAFAFPFAVWRRQRRFGAAFLWTLPVDRRELALTNVFAGWVWLMAGVAAILIWHATLAFVSGISGARTLPLFSLAGATGLYLLGSAFVLGLRHPLRWLLGAVGVVCLIGMFNEAAGRAILDWSHIVQSEIAARGIDTSVSSFVERQANAWRKIPPVLQWWIAAFLWIAAGFAALWPAAARHRERRN